MPSKTRKSSDRIIIEASHERQAGGEAENGRSREIGRGGMEEAGRTCHEPRLIMGSMVKIWPGLTIPFACVMVVESGAMQVKIA